jgi:hypothetical protein
MVQCRSCQRRFSPLGQLLGLAPRQRRTVSVPETPVVVVDLRERQPTVNECAAACIASSSD